MPDILIRGKKMPYDCPACFGAHYNRLTDKFSGCDLVIGKRYAIFDDPDYARSAERPDWCPLHELPDHGDLVDVGTAYDKIAEQETSYYMDMDGVDAGLQATPVIVPASEPTKSG